MLDLLGAGPVASTCMRNARFGGPYYCMNSGMLAMATSRMLAAPLLAVLLLAGAARAYLQ
eukprot:COSAG02_NODE_57046_length_282_cov_0.852459_1_plen_59_part_10